MLLDDPDQAVARLTRRAAGPMNQTQRDAHTQLECQGGLAAVPEMHTRLTHVIDRRPATMVVVPEGHIERTYREVLERIGST